MLKVNGILTIVLLTFLVINIKGCDGGNGNGGVETGVGKFIDGPVSGLRYVSGSQSGITNTEGTFIYEIGQPVTFSVGNVVLGQAAGREIITPVNLVSGGSSTNSTVLNMSRFLIMLDNDNDLNNGISISEGVRNVASNWSTINFSASDFESKVSNIMNDIGTVDNRTASLPSTSVAKSELEGTFFCAYSGGFTGTYTGDVSGRWILIIDPITGKVSGIGYNQSPEIFDFTITGQLSVNDSNSVAAGVANSTATWQGTVTSSGSFSGTWKDTPDNQSGTFSGNRVNLSLPTDAKGTVYKGTFSGSDAGTFTIAIDEDGNIRGTGYSGADDETFGITGALTENNIAIGSSSAGAYFTGTLASNGKTFSGIWSGNGNGTFSGCGSI